MAATEIIDRYLDGLPGATRRLADVEWGVTVESEQAGGHPLDIGLRLADGMLRAQAFVAPHHELLDPWLFLHWNRQTRLVRFATARNGDVWIHGEVPVAAVDERTVDRLLGLIAEGAQLARRYAADAMGVARSAN
jgi:hypothetical protein